MRPSADFGVGKLDIGGYSSPLDELHPSEIEDIRYWARKILGTGQAYNAPDRPWDPFAFDWADFDIVWSEEGDEL